MSRLRYIYGFLILIFLVGGFYAAKANGLFPDNKEVNYSSESNIDYSSIEGKGLPYPRGTHRIGEILKAYNLTKEEFYGELGIPDNISESSTIIELIKSGVITSKQVQAFMTPITQKFE